MITVILPPEAVRLLLFLLTCYRLTPAASLNRRQVSRWVDELASALEYTKKENL